MANWPPFVDTHVHFYDMNHPRLRYSWLEADADIDPVVGDDGAIRSQRYWADDFLAETRFQNVRSVVHVQAALGTEDPVEETRWLQSFADRTGFPQGIVAYVDLRAPNAQAEIERHLEFPNVRGIRDLRYDDYLHDDRWLAGYALLGRYGLICCDDPFIEEMELARRLASKYDDIVLCVDHAAFPGLTGKAREASADGFARWRSAIRDIAQAPNVIMKISGLGMASHDWTVETWRPWIHECLESFGVDRCVLGTNWPVDRLYSSYGDVLAAYAEITAELTDSEQRALFFENAERIFRLEQP